MSRDPVPPNLTNKKAVRRILTHLMTSELDPNDLGAVGDFIPEPVQHTKEHKTSPELLRAQPTNGDVASR
jgi:hypothetical protein